MKRKLYALIKRLKPCICLCACCFLISCAGTAVRHSDYSYFPIGVLEGSADLIISITDKSQKASDDITETVKELQKHVDTKDCQKQSPSEYVYLSRVTLKQRMQKMEIAALEHNVSPNAPHVTLKKGEMFTMPILSNKEIIVTVSNNHTEILKLICTGRIFTLQPNETVILHFQ